MDENDIVNTNSFGELNNEELMDFYNKIEEQISYLSSNILTEEE